MPIVVTSLLFQNIAAAIFQFDQMGIFTVVNVNKAKIISAAQRNSRNDWPKSLFIFHMQAKFVAASIFVDQYLVRRVFCLEDAPLNRFINHKLE